MHTRLSPREAELTRLIAQGMGTDAIAACTGLSPRDIERRLTALERKLGKGQQRAAQG